MKKITINVNETKSYVSEKVNTDKILARLTKRKDKTTNMRNERKIITMISRTLKEKFKILSTTLCP